MYLISFRYLIPFACQCNIYIRVVLYLSMHSSRGQLPLRIRRMMLCLPKGLVLLSRDIYKTGTRRSTCLSEILTFSTFPFEARSAFFGSRWLSVCSFYYVTEQLQRWQFNNVPSINDCETRRLLPAKLRQSSSTTIYTPYNSALQLISVDKANATLCVRERAINYTKTNIFVMPVNSKSKLDVINFLQNIYSSLYL